MRNALIAIVLVAICQFSAKASERISFGLDIPVVATEYRTAGHYETRVETVLVEAAKEVNEWVPAVIETRIINNEAVKVVIQEGFFRKAIIPARYESRTVTVWVPDVYVAAPVVYSSYYTPVYCGPVYYSRPSFGVSFGFGWHGDSHSHSSGHHR